MSAKKLLVVFGATGAQGGSVVRSVLGHPTASSSFKVRAITRDPSKPAAQELTKLGAECVAGNLNDKDSLRNALKDAHSVFAVTNFWESKSADVEIAQGKNIADLAKEMGVQHLVWSSLLDITKLSNGVLSQVTHFDSKAAVETYIRSIGVPATFFLPGFYMSNLPGQMMRPNPETGIQTLALPVPPTTPIPLFDAAADTGKFVLSALLNRDAWLGKQVLGATEYKTAEEIVEVFNNVKQPAKKAQYMEISHDMFKGFLGMAGEEEEHQEEVLQNMRLLAEFGYYGGRGLEESVKLAESAGEKLTTWEQFVEKAEAWKEL